MPKKKSFVTKNDTLHFVVRSYSAVALNFTKFTERIQESLRKEQSSWLYAFSYDCRHAEIQRAEKLH